ncbi:MAG TPA: NUDIX domain-containing protein [Pseudohongiella sp.]|nr:NUDIX domain-containing protein [Pseudohongiella sp.]
MSGYDPVYTHGDFEVVERKRVFQGFFAVDQLSLRHRLYAGGWSNTFTRELFVRGQAAGVLLYDPARDNVVMVEQFRVGMIDAATPEGKAQSPWALELVAGMVASDESPAEMALREVAEETGLEISSAEFVCQYYNSPGGSDECISIFYAEVDSSQAEGIHGLPDENEDIRAVVLPREDAMKAMREGHINNAMAIIALQWLQIKCLS